MSLRSTYRRIFDKIIVRLERESGQEPPRAKRVDAAKVRLQFVFKNITSPSYVGEVANCVSSGLVEAVGIEPTSKRPLVKATTCLGACFGLFPATPTTRLYGL